MPLSILFQGKMNVSRSVLPVTGAVYLFCVAIVLQLQMVAAYGRWISERDDQYQKGSVYCKSTSCVFTKDLLDEKASAYGTFNDSLLISGWGVLDIVAGKYEELTDAETMFAAGFLEGVLTARLMEVHYGNMKKAFNFDNTFNEKLGDWYVTQRQWADAMVEDNPDDPLWRHVSYINAQLDGLYAGYKSASGNESDPLDMFAVNFLNGMGDIVDLQYVLEPSMYPEWRKFSPKEAELFFYKSGHCSALVKVLPGFENILMSHSTWFLYSATNRIYKHYNLNVKDGATVARRMSFSSYPGSLESLDDFYVLGSGMVMLQTTNNIYNKTLYDLVKPESLFAWQRVRVANMMASSGKEWAEILSSYNSGTYNNQYMLIDLKLVQLETSIPDNTLWVAEQIPGLVAAQDVTQILRAGYWPSYNVPFFEEIYNRSGYAEYVEIHGKSYSYQLAPRAEIFRRDQSKVTDMESMKALLRYNDYKHDIYSGGSPWDTICARGDLDTNNPSYDGCFDTKVTDYKMATMFEADAINGPTLGTGLSPFTWDGAAAPHSGLPEVYNFTFIHTAPLL